ncbi:DMT family transporter [Gordonia oryzae]|uniref:DMT family transporter n=1 Tax=Gordonia oryzae TaxID=2487349 RepID=UPI001FE69586|nr:DMT family transporter [Gordonia oryzae]
MVAAHAGAHEIPPLPAAAFILLWAFGYPLGALGVSAMSPMALLTIRFAGSAAALGIIAVVTRRAFPRGRQLGHVAVVGLLTQFLQFGCAYLALQLGVPAVIVALVIALNPVATATLAWPVLGQRLGSRQWIGIAVGTAAVLAACLPRVIADASTMGIAVSLTLLALTGVALGGIYLQRFCGGVDLVAGNAVQLVVALIPTAAITLATPQSITDPLRAAWVLPTMIIASSMIATTLFPQTGQHRRCRGHVDVVHTHRVCVGTAGVGSARPTPRSRDRHRTRPGRSVVGDRATPGRLAPDHRACGHRSAGNIRRTKTVDTLARGRAIVNAHPWCTPAS